MWWDGHMGGWDWLWMTVMMVGFWGLVVVVIVLVARLVRTEDASTPSRPTSHEILAERFARGEIDEEEYRRRARTLSAPDERRSG
jgi:putative membrane protein